MPAGRFPLMLCLGLSLFVGIPTAGMLVGCGASSADSGGSSAASKPKIEEGAENGQDVKEKVHPVAAAKPAPTEAVATDLLDEAERNYLWEVEHHANILMDVAFKRMAQNLVKANAEGLASNLAEGFSAELPGETKTVKVDTEILHFQRARADDGPTVAADAGKFVETLLGYRALFHKEPKAKLSIMNLSPVEGRKNLDGPWKGTILFRMWGEADPGQPTDVTMQWEFTAPRPTKQTSRAERWLKSCKVLQVQVGHSSRFLMKPAGEERGIDVKRWWDNWPVKEQEKRMTDTGSVCLCDFNRDGCMDMLITDFNGVALYQGNPQGKFTDVAAKVGLSPLPWRGPLALFVDIDGDGWEDLLMGNKLFRNEEGAKFKYKKLTAEIGMLQAASNVSTVDYNLDGKMDLYVTVAGNPKDDSWIEGKSGRSYGNQLLMNLGNWKFKDVTKGAHAEGGFRSTFAAAWLDANGDGRPDVHVPNEFGNGVLLINQEDGTFKEQSLFSGPSDFGTMGLTVGDFNNDGNIDIYCANMYSKAGNRVIGNLRSDAYPPNIMALMNSYTKGSQLWKNNGNLSFEKMGAAFQVADVGWAYGPCMADLDNDGFLDIHATAGFISVDPNEPDG